MSEKAPLNNQEKLVPNVEHMVADKRERLASHEVNHGKLEDVESKARVAAEHARHAHEQLPMEQESRHTQHPALVRKDLKEIELSRTLTRVRKRLSRPSRAFSKVIHNPIIDETSEALGKTVARPAGFLWGSILAFVGTSALLWITNRYGYEFNYLAIMLLFGGGLLLGNLGELVWNAFRRKD